MRLNYDSSAKEKSLLSRGTSESTKAHNNVPKQQANLVNKPSSKNTFSSSSKVSGGKEYEKTNYKAKSDSSNRKSGLAEKEKNGEGKTKDDSSTKQKPPSKQSIFAMPTRNLSQLAADAVKADCMKQGYKIEKTVGEGAYAKVKLAEVLPFKLARNPDMAELADDEGTLKVAIKVIEARNVPTEFLQKFLPRELENHCPLPPHKNVVRVFEQFRTSDRIYVVMEYCSGGDLLDLINGRISESCQGLGEDKARTLFRMMAEGMHHIHTNGIVHRDLKCENILLDHEDNIKITDFGFSTQFVPGESILLKTSCGSYAYTAPEVIKQRPYDGTKSDNWSLGIILFAMLNGRLPFNDIQPDTLDEDMRMQRLRFERSVSFESMVLVRKILQYNPASRPTTADILCDPWLTGKHLIPRQTNTKGINNFQPKPPSLGKAVVGGMLVYYKGAVPDRNPDSTITVNQAKHETVTLKSRTGKKNNIWVEGPTITNRPKTWPRSDPSPRQPVQNRKIIQNSQTTVIVKDHSTKENPGKSENKARISAKTVQLSKWFMERYMAGKAANPGKKDSDTRKCCHPGNPEKSIFVKVTDECETEDPDVCFLDNGDVTHDFVKSVDWKFKYPVKNVPDLESYYKETDTLARAKTTSPNLCGRISSLALRKSHPKSANSVLTRWEKIMATQTGSPKKSKIISFMVNQFSSPSPRVKCFRNSLMKAYGKDKVEGQREGANGLPSFSVQSVKARHASASATQSATSGREAPQPQPPARKSPSCTRQVITNFECAGHRWTGSNVKPVQRYIVH